MARKQLARVWRWAALGRGIRQDVSARWQCYGDDWAEGWRRGPRILAPATYIFCASALPALVFGEQMANETGGVLSGVQVLAATAATGVLQAVVGGQPLMIVGVAEPIVLMYKYMYSFAEGQEGLGQELFLAWAAWACVFAAAMILLLSLLNACSYIDRFTRFAGELFGMLIAVLFMQQAIKGVRQEFLPPSDVAAASGDVSPEASEYQWRLVNGLWGLCLTGGFLLTSLWVRTARSWRFLNSPLRGLLADYGVPLLIVAWSGLSYAVSGTPEGVPRRMLIPNTWEVTSTWTVARDMGAVSGKHLATALVPAAMIALLFFFDHNVSSQLAQQREFNVKKPPAYHWDFWLLGMMTVLCGLLGMPPVNGVLPQSPLHSKALSSLHPCSSKKQKQRPASGGRGPGSTAGEAHGSMVELGQGLAHLGSGPRIYPLLQRADSASSSKDVIQGALSMEASPGAAAGAGASAPPIIAAAGMHASPSQQALIPAGSPRGSADPLPGGSGGADAEDTDQILPLQVSEQRLSGLLQSLGVAACLGATPAIKLIPSAVLSGYFAFMSVESLPGSQFWERLLLLGTDPKRRYRSLEAQHAPFLETVPFQVISYFTLFQLAYLLAVYGLTWAGIAGCLFPIPIMLLVPIRQYLMPHIFRPEHLQELDALEAEAAPPLPHEAAVQEAAETGLAPAPPGAEPEPDVMAVLERETARFQVVHHLPRASLERRRRSVLGAGGSSGAAREGGSGGGA